MSPYRPWGILDWVLSHSSTRDNWALLGSLSTDERCLSAWRSLRSRGQLASVRLLRIANKPSRYDLAIEKRESDRITEFVAEGGDENDIEPHYLLQPVSNIVDTINHFLGVSGPNVVLDVSALPKRFFFPMLKILHKEAATVANLIVTYTSPQGYTPEKLSENQDDWDHIPLFSGSYSSAKPKMMVINVGFEGAGLQEQVDHGDAGLPIKLLFPFPAPPWAFARSWELVRRLQKNRLPDAFRIYQTDSREVSDAFDRLLTLTERGRHRIDLAPFGPKPISVAMCVFATLTESPVFYSQPKVYHSDYSYGVAQVAGVPAVWAYCIRLNGNDYYRL